MGAPEVQAFLTHLAVEENVAASTQNQALSALLFLYNVVLHQDLGPIDAMRAKKPKRLPSVLTKEEVHPVLGHLSGTHLLMAKLLHGSGLRLIATTSRSQPAQIERLKLVPGVAQRGVPVVAANATEVGRAEGEDQITDLVARQDGGRDNQAAHLTQAPPRWSPHLVQHLDARPCLYLKEELVIVGHPGPLLVPLLAKHTFCRTIDLADHHLSSIQRVECRLILGVDAWHAAQSHDLRLPQVLGIDLVGSVQVAGELDGSRADAAHQCHVLILALSIGQLEARLPLTDRLAAP
jgi:hypothetical protein